MVAGGSKEAVEPALPALKAGIEIHQQLATGKLFCRCESDLSEEVLSSFRRFLRVARSETGEVDAAAAQEVSKGLEFVYERTPNSCLVEMDEEPPHPLDKDALEVALIVARMLKCRVVDEVEVMRKIVVDGSNTSGFQRTCLIAVDGELEVSGKKISISSLCLEEDAARKPEVTHQKREGEVAYRLDRLGIPLIEIATGPDMTTPDEVQAVAAAIGSILRATGRVRRGIGTIREDLNVSVPGGARVEIKGVQELRMVKTYVEEEAHRQRRLLEAVERLRARGGGTDAEPTDLTSVFRLSTSGVVKQALAQHGKVLALGLHNLAGVLGEPEDERGKGRRVLGPELAGHARVAGVAGLFHSDELPGYGIGAEEIEEVRRHLHLKPDDAFVLVAAPEDKARAALARVKARVEAALQGATEETRDPQPDGTTRYSRPLPGRARMYPETDVPPVPITKEMLAEIERRLPEFPEVRISRLAREFSLAPQVARQLVGDGYADEFESLARVPGQANVVARVLTAVVPQLVHDGLREPTLLEIRGALGLVAAGKVAKEAIDNLLAKISVEKVSAEEAAAKLGVLGAGGASQEDAAREFIRGLVKERAEFVKQRGEAAHGPLMGPVMKEWRGKVDGEQLAQMLRKEIEELLGRK
jgi:glutamyl-tRNA(Gln) amidotransferase subunit E